MLKAAGILLILSAGAGAGLSGCAELSGRERALESLQQMVLLLRGEIRYGNVSLCDAFAELSGKLSDGYGPFLMMVSRQMRAGGRPLGEIFRECARRELAGITLSRREWEAFFSFGERLGNLDLDTQLSQIALYEQDLELSLRELREEMPEKKKVYRSLGLFGGLLIAILLW